MLNDTSGEVGGIFMNEGMTSFNKCEEKGKHVWVWEWVCWKSCYGELVTRSCQLVVGRLRDNLFLLASCSRASK